MRFIFLFLLPFSFLFGEAKGREINVAVSHFSPLVFENNEGLSGFDIDLLKEIGKRNNWNLKFRLIPFNDIIPNVKESNFDMGAAGITITHDRSKDIDFSMPYMDSGLQLVIPTSHEVSWISVINILKSKLIDDILFFCVGLIVFALILWMFELGSNDSIQNKFFPGVFQSLWCVFAIVTTIGFGDIAPKTWVARGLTVFIAIFGIGFFGYMVGDSFTIICKELDKTNITDIENFRDKSISTRIGTTSEAFLRSKDIAVDATTDISESYMNLLSATTDAVLFDTPSVLYFAKKHPYKFTTLDTIYQPQYYGFVFPSNSVLRKETNNALLSMRDDGTYDTIYDKWFK